MTITEINDTELFYTRIGSGTPFLVMHGGLGFDHSYFRPELDLLGESIELIYYDHRGNGRSGRPPISSITFEQLADDAEELRKVLGYDRIGVIGHSFGGFVALKYAIKYPENLSFLIPMNIYPAFDRTHTKAFVKGLQAKNPSPELMKTFNSPPARTIEEFRINYRILNYLYVYDYKSEIKKRFEKMFDKMILNLELSAITNKLITKFNVLSDLNKISTPTLVVGGSGDGIIPASQVQRLHNNIPNSDIHIFEKSGHYPFFEEPEAFIKVILDWVNTVK